MACDRNYNGCCCCNDGFRSPFVNNLCPEWSSGEMKGILTLDLEILSATAGFCSLTPLCALIIAYLTQANLKDYKFDFV